MKDEIKEILDKLEIVARKHTIEVCEDGSKIETKPASVVDELRLNNYSSKLLLDYIINLQTIEREYSAILSENVELQGKIMKLKDELEKRRREYQETYKDVRIEFKEKKETITNLQEKYDEALELLNEYGMPCERDNFNLLDTDYCELNCSNDDEQFKKCWNEFIEWRLKDE